MNCVYTILKFKKTVIFSKKIYPIITVWCDTPYNDSHIPHEGKLYRHSLLSLQGMVAFHHF
jgi:hypothetical protein